MIFGKLLPREGNFFELFNDHGARIGEGARAFMNLVTHYKDLTLRAKYAADVDGAERAADRITADVHHPHRP